MTRLAQRARLLVWLGAVGLAAVGCKAQGGQAPPPSTHAATVVSPGPSIYPLHVPLRDQNGDAIDVDVFRGHPVIVSMFYGSCPAACPLLVTHMKRLEAALPQEARANVRVLLVSFDAERDTPDALRELARAHKVDPDRWRFASAGEDDARVLANALGVHFRKGEGGAFSHDSVITVLDGQGRVIARTEDVGGDQAPLVKALQ